MTRGQRRNPACFERNRPLRHQGLFSRLFPRPASRSQLQPSPQLSQSHNRRASGNWRQPSRSPIALRPTPTQAATIQPLTPQADHSAQDRQRPFFTTDAHSVAPSVFDSGQDQGPVMDLEGSQPPTGAHGYSYSPSTAARSLFPSTAGNQPPVYLNPQTGTSPLPPPTPAVQHRPQEIQSAMQGVPTGAFGGMGILSPDFLPPVSENTFDNASPVSYGRTSQEPRQHPYTHALAQPSTPRRTFEILGEDGTWRRILCRINTENALSSINELAAQMLDPASIYPYPPVTTPYGIVATDRWTYVSIRSTGGFHRFHREDIPVAIVRQPDEAEAIITVGEQLWGIIERAHLSVADTSGTF